MPRKNLCRDVLVGTLSIAIVVFSLAASPCSWAQESSMDIDFELPEEFADFGADSDFGAPELTEEEEATADGIRNGVLVGGGCVVALAAAVVLRKKKKAKA